MKKIMIDIGHGGADSGASANGLVEKELNLKIGLLVQQYLQGYKADVRVSRDKDITLEPNARVKLIKAYNPDVCVSIHLNSASNVAARGAEVIHAHADTEDDKLAGLALEYLGKCGIPTRKSFTKLNDRGQDWYFMIRDIASKNTKSIIVEIGFLSNKDDVALLKTDTFIQAAAKAVSQAIVDYLKLAQEALTPIMGTGRATARQMVAYATGKNPIPQLPYCSVDELAGIFVEEGKIEGINWDVAWAQALKETGFFRYGNIVRPSQNNYAGIGALNDNKQGEAATFKTPREGVRAQIQHLKAYASTEPLKQECVDPRFGLVKRGSAKYVEWLGAGDNPDKVGWCYPGHGYGSDIVKMMDVLGGTKVVETKEHWGQNAINELLEMKIINTSHDPNKTVTWAEFAAVITRIIKQNKEQHS